MKKYWFIDEIDLPTVLQEKSISELCRELSESTGVDYQVLHSCITWRKRRHFTAEQQKLVKRDKKKRTFWEIERDKAKET